MQYEGSTLSANFPHGLLLIFKCFSLWPIWSTHMDISNLNPNNFPPSQEITKSKGEWHFIMTILNLLYSLFKKIILHLNMKHHYTIWNIRSHLKSSWDWIFISPGWISFLGGKQKERIRKTPLQLHRTDKKLRAILRGWDSDKKQNPRGNKMLMSVPVTGTSADP